LVPTDIRRQHQSLNFLSRSTPTGTKHYARTLKRRRALTKKGDAWSGHLRHCVTHYNVIGDARKCILLILQYMRCILQTFVSHHVKKLRRVIRVTRLALGDCLSYYDTNRKRMFSETCLRLSYAPSEFLQATGCILELFRIQHPHSTCRNHIFTFTYKGTYG
jgi:hypothetical protein